MYKALIQQVTHVSPLARNVMLSIQQTDYRLLTKETNNINVKDIQVKHYMVPSIKNTTSFART